MEFPRHREIKTDSENFFDLEDFKDTKNLGGTFAVYENGKQIGTLYQFKQQMYVVNLEDTSEEPFVINYKDLVGDNKKYDLKFIDKENSEEIPVFIKEPKWEYVSYRGTEHTKEQKEAEERGDVILRLMYASYKQPEEQFIDSVNCKGFKECLCYYDERGEVDRKTYKKNKQYIAISQYRIDKGVTRKKYTQVFEDKKINLNEIYTKLKEVGEDIDSVVTIRNYIYDNTKSKYIYYI